MEQVKKQYTKYTYPKYDKYMDKFAPIPNQCCSNLFLEQINHYIYSGLKTNFDGFKILVVGVGLGTDIINMGVFLKKYKNIKLLGIDVSPTALNICRERITTYNIDCIELVEMSLLDLNPMVHGKFDMIICIGVLHHLENPSDGLNALVNVLEDDGVMNIMVYGKYGRTGVYQMQELMKKINSDIDINDYETKINNFKNIHTQLTQNNWFRLSEHLISDHTISDEGVVDMILHCQDRAYSIPELYCWINNSHLNIIDFSPDTRYKYNYNINNVKYPNDIVEKHSINELFFGDIIKHMFYVSKNTNTKATIDNLDNILILVLVTKEWLNNVLHKCKPKKGCLSVLFNCFCRHVTNLNVTGTLMYKLDDEYIWYLSEDEFINFNIEMNNIIYTILNNIDNEKSIKEIFNIVRKELNINVDNNCLLQMFKPVYEKFELYDMILLRGHPPKIEP